MKGCWRGRGPGNELGTRLCAEGRDCGQVPSDLSREKTGPQAAAGEGVSPSPAPLTPLRGSATGALPSGCTATGGRQGPLPGPLAPAPLHWPLLPSSAPLDSFPSAPWAHRSRLRTGSARRGSCCRLRGGGNGGCGGDGASGRASGGSRARPGSPSSASARRLGPSRWTPQSPGRLFTARVYGMEAGPSGAGKGPREPGAVCVPEPGGLPREEHGSRGRGGALRRWGARFEGAVCSSGGEPCEDLRPRLFVLGSSMQSCGWEAI